MLEVHPNFVLKVLTDAQWVKHAQFTLNVWGTFTSLQYSILMLSKFKEFENNFDKSCFRVGESDS